MIRKIAQILMIVWAGFITAATAAEQREFSADVITQAGGQTIAGKMYVSKDKSRYEMPQAITITRLDRHVAYILMPTEKMVMEHPLDRLAAAKAGIKSNDEMERVLMGKETLDGRSTDKFRVTYKGSDSSITIFQWLDANQIPAKIEAEDGSWSVEYKNVNMNSQPDSLFEVPAGYQTFTMPSMAEMHQGVGMGSSSVPDADGKPQAEAGHSEKTDKSSSE